MTQPTVNDYFEFKCWKGFQARGLEGKTEYKERLEYEIAVIKRMGFPGYFLIVADFLTWARRNSIPTGPGRGSAAGSLVAYCLGITHLDPLRFGLLFERFLNPDRVSMPDIDCDFCEKHRDEVIQYVVNKYGRDKVAQIGTFGTMKAKGAIKDTAKTLGYPLQLAEKLANLVPPPKHGKPIPLAESYKLVPELDAYHKSSTPESETLKWADRVENTIKSYGIHASGVVISPEPLWKDVPLALGRKGEQATQLEMNAIEQVGLIKFDFLGLRTLTVIQTTLDLIKKHRNITLDINTIPLDDDEVYGILRAGDTMGLFQLEASSGMRELLIGIRPRHLEDIIALVAMYRPGPLSSDGLRMYLDVRAGKREPEYAFPVLEPILKPTSGWIIYQEQVMQIAVALSGYTRSQADDLRKAIGKKIPDKMKKHREIFITGALKNGHDKDKVVKLYDSIEEFGYYGFNKSHAACYAYITYQTAYLKKLYPIEFMCAALTCDQDSPDKVIKYLTECKRLDIKILPPSINESNSGFTISNGAIRFGLAAVKNLGEEPVSYIVKSRETPFKDIIDFCNRVDLGKINRKKLESLILAGAFDFCNLSRTSLLATIDRVWDYKSELKKYESKYETYLKKLEACKQREQEITSAKSNTLKKVPSSLKPPTPPQKPEEPTHALCPEMDMSEKLKQERELLGFYISGHPLDSYSSILQGDDISKIGRLSETDVNGTPIFRSGEFVRTAGIISAIEEKTTKKGDLMAFASIEDKTGQVDLVIFAETYKKIRNIIGISRPFLIKGKVELSQHGEEDSESINNLTAKIIAFQIEELVKGNIQFEPVTVTIKPHKVQDFLEVLSKYPGEARQVNLVMKTNDGSLFRTSRVYSVGGEIHSFLREVGKISS